MKYIDRLSKLNQRFFHGLGRHRERSFPGEVEKNQKLCEIRYCRNIAVELNNISIDFYTHGKYKTAMEFCSDAVNVLILCSNAVDQPMTKCLDDDIKQILSSKIKHAKERLQTMGSGDTTRISTLGCSDGFVCVLKGIRLGLNSPLFLHFDSATVLYNIALIHMRTGSLMHAKEMLESVISMVFTHGSCHTNCINLFLTASNNLGCIHQKQHNNQHAVDMLIESQTYLLNKNAMLNEESRSIVAAILCNVGSIEVAKGNYEKAAEVLNVSLDVMIKEVEENHPDAACIMLKIGKVQFELGQTSDSMKRFLDVIRIQRMTFGNDHYSVAEPMYRLGIIFETLGEYENALNAYEHTAQIELTTLGPNHSDLASTLYSVGRMQYEHGDIDLALQTHKKAMVIIEASSDIDPVFVASNLVAMGKIYRENGMRKESQNALSSSKKILLEVEPKKRGAEADILIGLIDCDLAHPVAAATA